MTKLRTQPPPPSLAPAQQAQAAALIVTLKQRLLAECPDAAPELSPPAPSLTIDSATKALVTPPVADPPHQPPADSDPPAAIYRLQTKQGVTTFRTGDEWLACWAKIVRGCKAANALDKLQAARDTNAAHIADIAAFDPEPAATLIAELDRALAPPSSPPSGPS